MLTAKMAVFENFSAGRLSSGRHRRSLCRKTLCLLALACCLQPSSAFFGEWGPDLEGPWCATRPVGQQCCTGRDDNCDVPILGTRCYCDIFCNDTAYDCCPDYWPHCHGYVVATTTPRPTTLPPPRRDEPCKGEDGRLYDIGESYKDNCNTCTCSLTFTPVRRSRWNCTDYACLIRPELIQAVNDGDYSWRASNYSQLWGQTLDHGIRYRLGTFLLDEKAQKMFPKKVPERAMPDFFDARNKWRGKLHPIQDQGNCGSSWAHSSIAVTSDRLSVLSVGVLVEKLSVQHLISCHPDIVNGCQGGHVDRAWWYIKNQGVVTEACYPYTSGATNNVAQCLIWDNQTNWACPSGSPFSQKKRYHSAPPYRIAGERQIMNEIYESGPVQAFMEVREDFFMYKSGIYSYARLSQRRGDSPKYRRAGYHSVRIMGWGYETNELGQRVNYWICANSWGPNWGENGYFRILRGVGESEIESIVIGAWANVVGDPEQERQLEEGRRARLSAALDTGETAEYRSLPTGRRKRILMRQALMRLRKQKNNRGAGKAVRRRWRGGKKKAKKAGKKLSWKEKQARRRERRQRRRQRRREQKLKLKAKEAKSQGVQTHL